MMADGTGTDLRRHRPRRSSRGSRLGALLALLAILPSAASALAASPHRHPTRRPWTDGVVRCVAASAPNHRHPVSAARRGGGPPTDRAVFFARSGDRCAWHRHGGLGRG